MNEKSAHKLARIDIKEQKQKQKKKEWIKRNKSVRGYKFQKWVKGE